MKTNKFLYILSIFACGSLASCEKEQAKELTKFNVTTEKSVYKVGETVTFNLEGNPLQIAFYSGEVGSDVQYKTGRELPIQQVKASFSTNVAYGAQPNLLSVWVSTDFNGKYTIQDIRAATWKNSVTKSFALAPESQSSTSASVAVSSGIKDLSSETEPGKPLYVAFKYRKLPDSQAGQQRNWFIRNFNATASTSLGDFPLITGDNFNLVYDENYLPENTADRTSVISTSSVITFRGPNSSSPLAEKIVEIWAVSSPIAIDKVNGGSDLAIPVKGYSDVKKDKMTYVYAKEGKYRVAFVASNKTVKDNAEVVKYVDIEVVK